MTDSSRLSSITFDWVLFGNRTQKSSLFDCVRLPTSVAWIELDWVRLSFLGFAQLSWLRRSLSRFRRSRGRLRKTACSRANGTLTWLTIAVPAPACNVFSLGCNFINVFISVGKWHMFTFDSSCFWRPEQKTANWMKELYFQNCKLSEAL